MNLKNEAEIERDFIFYNRSYPDKTREEWNGGFEIDYRENFIYDYRANTPKRRSRKIKDDSSLFRKNTAKSNNHSKFFSSFDLEAVYQQNKKYNSLKSGYKLCDCGKFLFAYRFIDRKE